MDNIISDLKRYQRKTRKTTSEGETRTYTTTQYIITLKKDEIERAHFQEVEQVAIIPATQCPALKTQLSNGQLYPELKEKYEALENEHNQLINQHQHTQAHNNKLQRQLNTMEEELTQWQNRGLVDYLVATLRGKKKNKTLPEGKA